MSIENLELREGQHVSFFLLPPFEHFWQQRFFLLLASLSIETFNKTTLRLSFILGIINSRSMMCVEVVAPVKWLWTEKINDSYFWENDFLGSIFFVRIIAFDHFLSLNSFLRLVGLTNIAWFGLSTSLWQLLGQTVWPFCQTLKSIWPYF